MPLGPLQEAWLQALESGDYKQGEVGTKNTADQQNSLSLMNDKGKTFMQIAAEVRKHPSWYFKKAV